MLQYNDSDGLYDGSGRVESVGIGKEDSRYFIFASVNKTCFLTTDIVSHTSKERDMMQIWICSSRVRESSLTHRVILHHRQLLA
jgi:hypothetical protein